MFKNFSPKLNKKVSSSFSISLEPEKIDQEGIRSGLETDKEYSSEQIIIPQKFTSSVVVYDHHFTNYISGNDEVLNDYLLANWEQLKNNTFYYIKHLKTISSDTKNRKRLSEICKKYDWKLKIFPEGEAEDIFNLMKVDGVRHKELNSLRMYVGINTDKNVQFLFLDPHHLAIPSAHNNLDAETVKQQTFIKCQYYKKDIAEFLS